LLLSGHFWLLSLATRMASISIVTVATTTTTATVIILLILPILGDIKTLCTIKSRKEI